MTRPLVALAFALASTAAAQAPEHRFLSVDALPDADGPVALGWTVDGSFVLIVHRDSGSLTFLDPAGPAVIASVAVGDDPTDLALTQDGRYALLPLRTGDALAVVDVAARSLAATVPLAGSRPYRVDAASDSTFAVVALEGSGPGTSSVSVVDLVTLQESFAFPTADQGPYVLEDSQLESYLGTRYPRIDLAPDDRTLLLPTAPTYALRGYDVQTGGLLGSAGLPAMFPVAVRATQTGNRAIVAAVDGVLFGFYCLYEIDLASFQLSCLLSDGYFDVPTEDGLAITPDGSLAIVAAQHEGKAGGLFCVPLTGGSYCGSQAGGHAVTVTADGAYAVVVRASNGPYPATVGLLDLAQGAVVDEVVTASGLAVAAAPMGARVAVLQSLEDEIVEVFDVANGVLVSNGAIPTGPGIEGDHPAVLAVDRAGGVVVTANLHSDNLTVVDLESGTPTSWLPTLDRPSHLLLTDAGRTALVAYESGGLSLVELASGTHLTVLDDLPPPRGLAHVEALGRAWLLGDDGALYVVRIAGAASGVLARVLVGAGAGSAPRQVASRADGLVAVTRPYANELALIDGIDGTVSHVLSVVSGAKEVALTPEGFAYIAGHNRLQRIDVRGVPLILGKVSLNFPRMPRVDEAAGYVYVATGYPGAALSVVELQGMTKVQELPLPADVADMELAHGALLLALEDGTLLRVRAAGAATELIGAPEPLAGAATDLVLLPELGQVLAAQPGAQDGIDVVDFTRAARYCDPANANSTGAPGRIRADGWTLAGAPLFLVAEGLPAGRFGTFLLADKQGFVPFVGGGQGNLCLAGSLGRFSTALSSGATGSIALVVDTTVLPQPGGPLAVQPGDTWYFQAWYRDTNPGPTSNTSDGIGVLFG